MAGRNDDPYGENEVDAAEEAELRKLMESNEVPPEDNQDGASTDHDGEQQQGDDDDAPEPQDNKAAAPEQPQDTNAEAGDDQDNAGDWEAFLAKHKGKSAEELAKLAFQQQKRANREAYDGRQSHERLQSLLDRIQQTRDRQMQELQQKRADFEKRVNEDPDAALREAHSERLAEQERQISEQAEREAFQARAAQAIDIAARAIPNFHEEAPKIAEWAQKDMGFSPEEVAGIADARMIGTLYLARIAGNMMKAGIINADGTMGSLPQAVQTNGDGRTNDVQRRTSFGKQPARGAQVAKSFDEQLSDIANMSDEDFGKLSESELEALLSQEGLQ